MTSDLRSPPDCPVLQSLRAYLYHVARQYIVDGLRQKANESDFVQQALLAAHQKRDQFRGSSPGEYRGWVRTILLNHMRNFYRKHRAAAAGALPDEVGLEDVADDDAPLTGLLDEEQVRELGAAVAGLSADHRQVLTLRFEHGRTFVQIGALMGRSADAARMLLDRALIELRRRLPPVPD